MLALLSIMTDTGFMTNTKIQIEGFEADESGNGVMGPGLYFDGIGDGVSITREGGGFPHYGDRVVIAYYGENGDGETPEETETMLVLDNGSFRGSFIFKKRGLLKRLGLE
jgi:hypothetical protein